MMKYIVALIVSILILTSILFIHLMPASIWFEVKDVFVYDTVVGEVPVIEIDRVIHRPFRGSYVVDVERLNKSGFYTPICTAFSATNYRPDAQLPDPATLDWWTFPIHCTLRPGTYRVETSWKIESDWFLFPDKHVTNVSNDFIVRLRD